MKLPNLLYGNNKTRLQTVAFGGVNYSENHREGEWEETENLGSGRYPTLAPRMGRGKARECEGQPTALYAWEELASVEGTGFYYGGKYIGEVSAGPKQMVRVGDQIVIWPDRKYYNWKTGAFTALAVGFTLPMGLASAIGDNYIALPQTARSWEPTGAEQVTYTGKWLGVARDARAGKKYKFTTWEKYSGDAIFVKYENAAEKSIEQAQVGQMVMLESVLSSNPETADWGKILEVRTQVREYMPGVTRSSTDIVYQEYTRTTYGDISAWKPAKRYDEIVIKTLSGWTYGTPSGISGTQTDANLGTTFYQMTSPRYVADDLKPQEGYEYAVWPGLNGPLTGAASNSQDGSKKLVQVGDLFFYDAATGKAQMLTAIDRQWYVDHYYTSSYTLQEVSLVMGAENTDPETLAGRVSMSIGDRVRVSRGSASVDTRIAGYDASYTYDYVVQEAPGMVSAPYGISFTDDISALWTQSGVVSIDRITEPDLTYICVHDNRLWGVHEGRIWCSKFGDPQNFDTDTGTDADAWWTEVGSPGDWTGIVSYSGAVLAFKENLVHKVVGDLPSEFTVSTYNIAGIQPGSHQSAVIVNEVLYYKGTAGIYAYSGYTPNFMSDNFGQRRFSEAVGGTDGVRYYISMRDEDGAWNLYCYDTLHGVWLREDGLHIAACSLYDGKLYCAAAEQKQILTFGEKTEQSIVWQAISVPFTEGSFDRKLYTKLLIRAELTPGSAIRVSASYDGGEWVRLYDKRGTRRGVSILPVRPKRCDRFRLKIEGEGDVTLLGMAREVLTGSEV